jgi:hypothetical protein
MLWPVICQGRTISQEALEWLRGWIGAHRDWSRKRLARELCVLWDWRNGMGRLKDFAARSFLLKLAERELIELPPVREYKRSGPQRVGWVKADFEHTPEPLCAQLEQVRPVQLDWVEAGSDPARRVAFYLDRYHYLGWHVVGQNIGYLARDSSGQDLAVLLFGAAAWRCAPRDRHLDWSESERLIGLHRIANNSRFLILPYVRVPHLASHLLALVARRINADWQQKYGHGLDWLESFVELGRFRGTCYQAANWRCVGQTRGRSRYDRDRTLSVPPKAVYLYRLR